MNASDTHESKLVFRNEAYFDTRFNDVKSIDADLCLVLLEVSNTIFEVVDWRTESRSSFPLDQDMVEAVSLIPLVLNLMSYSMPHPSYLWTTFSPYASVDPIFCASGIGPLKHTLFPSSS